MKIDYARQACEYVQQIVLAETTSVSPSGIGLGIGYLPSQVEPRECVILLEVEGAQTARNYFRSIASHLGFPGELVSQPERGNVWLKCQHHCQSIQESLVSQPQRPGSRWVCHLTSLPGVLLPGIQHYRIEDALEMRYGEFSGDYADDEGLVEVRDLVVQVAEVLFEYEELADELQICGYRYLHESGDGLTAVGLSSIRSLAPLKPFIEEVLHEVNPLNAVGVFDIQQNPWQAAESWQGNYAVILGRSVYARRG